MAVGTAEPRVDFRCGILYGLAEAGCILRADSRAIIVSRYWLLGREDVGLHKSGSRRIRTHSHHHAGRIILLARQYPSHTFTLLRPVPSVMIASAPSPAPHKHHADISQGTTQTCSRVDRHLALRAVWTTLLLSVCQFCISNSSTDTGISILPAACCLSSSC